ncbi:MAG: hypothetical protein ACOYJ1_00960 [Peptococcales bacterium]|jgi:hypothetical protein
MYQHINATFLADGVIYTTCLQGEYSTALIQDGKVYPLGTADTEDAARAMHQKWADHYQALDAANA